MRTVRVMSRGQHGTSIFLPMAQPYATQTPKCLFSWSAGGRQKKGGYPFPQT